MCLSVYELKLWLMSACNWRSGACVFYNTSERGIHLERTNSGIQFDRCETSQRNVFIAAQKEFTVVVSIPLLMWIYHPITNLGVSSYQRYREWRFFGHLALKMHLTTDAVRREQLIFLFLYKKLLKCGDVSVVALAHILLSLACSSTFSRDRVGSGWIWLESRLERDWF